MTERRESEANIVPDIDRPVRLKREAAVAGLFALMCVGTLIIDCVFSVPQVVVLGEAGVARHKRLVQSRLIDGTRARLIDEYLKETSRVRLAVTGPWACALLVLGETSRPEVIQGSDGWLFLRARTTRRDGLTEDGIAYLASVVSSVHRLLALQGTRLVVMPVPPKGIVYPQHLPADVDAQTRDYYVSFVGHLRDRGVPVIDVLREMERHAGIQLFCRTDTHWSFDGARIAAEAVARTTRKWIPPEARATVLETAPDEVDTGDLFRLLGLPTSELHYGLARWVLERADRLHYLPRIGVIRREGRAIPETPETSCRLHGSSFSNASGFADYLAHFTNSAIRIHSQRGVGFVDGLLSIVGGAAPTSEPTTVVWEFPWFPAPVNKPTYRPLGEVFTSLAPTSGTPLDPLGPMARFPTSDSLRPGQHRLYERGSSARLIDGGFFHCGDGSVFVRLTGTVTGGDVLVSTRAGSDAIDRTWRRGQGSAVVPLVASAGTCENEVRVRSHGGRPVLELLAIDLVANLVLANRAEVRVSAPEVTGNGWRQSVRLSAPPGVRERDALAIALDYRWPGRRSLIVHVTTPEVASSPMTWNVGELRADARGLITVGRFAGAQSLHVELRGEGPPPEGTSRIELLSAPR